VCIHWMSWDETNKRQELFVPREVSHG
jgi:hypothetical protein